MFGLSFGSPILLAGTALGLAPIIIHLLNRRRFRTVRWAAMKFLLASQKRNRRRIRLEQILLLLIRTLILLFLALAIAQPRVDQGSLAALAARQPHRQALFLLDNSFSMAYEKGAQSLFERAKSIARQISQGFTEGDQASLFLFSDRPSPVIKDPTYNLSSLNRELERAALSHAATDIPAALLEAARIVAASNSPNKEVYLITDMQRVGWHLDRMAGNAEIAHALESLSKQAEVFLFDVGNDEAINASVTELGLSSSLVLVGQSARATVTVKNFSAKEMANRVISFYVNGRKQGSATRSIHPWGKAKAEFTHVFRDTVAHTIQAAVDRDGLPLDDGRFLTLQARESIRVLLLDGVPEKANGMGETRFLRAALAPAGAGRSFTPIAPEVLLPYEVKSADFSDKDAVILANVALLNPEILRALEAYVKDGGTLFIFPGTKTEKPFYNRNFYRNGQGLLPLPFESTVTADTRAGKYFFLSPKSYDHPMLAMFQGLRTAPLTSSQIYSYIKLEAGKNDPDVRMVCPYDNGDPAIVEKSFGLGKTILFTTSADTSWTDLPRKPVFLPLLHESINSVVRSYDPGMNLQIGEPFTRILKPQEMDRQFLVSRIRGLPGEPANSLDGQKPYQVASLPTNGRFALTFKETRQGGVYRVTSASRSAKLGDFCVNLPSLESDLRRLQPGALRKVFPGFKFRYATGPPDSAASVQENKAQKELWRTLVWSVFCLVCLESFLAHRFGK